MRIGEEEDWWAWQRLALSSPGQLDMEEIGVDEW